MTKNEREVYRRNLKLWIIHNWRIGSGNHAGDRYSFHRRQFLEKYIDDRHHHKIFMKSAQCGVSELAIAEMFAIADLERGNHMYVFPAKEQLRSFAKTRIHSAIEYNPYIAARTAKSYSLSLVPFGRNNMYLRGAESPRDVESVDASYLFLDERDLFNETTVSILYKRLQGKEDTFVREFSTPRLPKSGIDAQYSGGGEIGLTQGTDMRRWHVWCTHCGKSQIVEWADDKDNLINFRNKGTEYYPDLDCVCRYCEMALDPAGPGEWVAGRPEMTGIVHGYQISAWTWPIFDPNPAFIEWLNIRTRQTFMKYTAGLPYLPPGSQITDEMIEAARGRHYNAQWEKFDGRTDPVLMGVDLGIPHYYWLGYPDGTVIEKGTCREFDEIGNIIGRRKVIRAVIDYQPDTEKVNKLKPIYPGKIYSCQFAKKFDEKYQEDWQVDMENHHLWVNRHNAMLSVQEDVKNGAIKLPVDIMDDQGFVSHMKVHAKVLQEDERGNMSYIFPDIQRPDHFFFAGLYFNIAREIYNKTAVRVLNWDFRGVEKRHDSHQDQRQMEFRRQEQLTDRTSDARGFHR